MQKTILAFTIAITIQASAIMAQGLDSLPSRVYNLKSLIEGKKDAPATIPVMEGSTTSLSRFEVHSTTIKPGLVSHTRHSPADMEELIIVKEGKVKVTIKGTTKILDRGSIAYFMPGEEHSVENADAAPATFYVLEYKSKLPGDNARATKSGGSFMLGWNDVAFNKNEKGGRKNFFNRSTSQLEKFEMHTTALNPGLESHAPHTHKEEEIILILRGNVKMHIDGQLYPAEPGDVVFLASGIPHALLNTGKEQTEYFAFQWRN
ncbi:MAG: cupin domain-containing protein [Chitinophagaceae bacterium]|nr:MAG: cupin domain-containing protein [Chitinophagaceae bacterium]